jgi:hypothetical protein
MDSVDVRRGLPEGTAYIDCDGRWIAAKAKKLGVAYRRAITGWGAKYPIHTGIVVAKADAQYLVEAVGHPYVYVDHAQDGERLLGVGDLFERGWTRAQIDAIDQKVLSALEQRTGRYSPSRIKRYEHVITCSRVAFIKICVGDHVQWLKPLEDGRRADITKIVQRVLKEQRVSELVETAVFGVLARLDNNPAAIERICGLWNRQAA